jgi:cytochrome c biogenesis protein CcmG/thiol:disulfide interchange protein DsbE
VGFRASSLAVGLTVVAIAGCGASQPKSAAPSTSAVTSAFKGSPPALASLHSQANQLLGGGPHALKARLAQLRGYPVVLNQWASWCEPCQSEFPVYQKVAVAFGRKVAFLGIDAKDQNGAASSFLKKFPVTYPSYTDPDGSLASSLQLIAAYPQTIYFNRHGEQVFDHAGPYLSAAALEKDIRRYAMG